MSTSLRKRAACTVLAALIGLAGAAFGGELKRWGGGATPPLALKDASGALHDLKAYRGKVVLINFWATWCEPCRDEMPSLQRLRARLSNLPFTILAINMGESEEKAASFLKPLDIDLKVVFDKDTSAAKQWKVRTLPATFVIDTKGNIRYSLLGEAQWDSRDFVAAISRLFPRGAP